MPPVVPLPAPPVRASSDHASRDAEATACALAAKHGDEAATERLFQLLNRDVWRFVAYLASDAQAADDLTQETFLRALGSLHRFEGRSSARTWLLTIARRTVIDSIRTAAARPRSCGAEDWQGAAERGQFHPPGFDEEVALSDLIAALPEDRREAFVLTQLLGVPYQDAADACRCPVGTVRSRVARARASLCKEVLAAETDADAPALLSAAA